jgi:hypothetical protein
MVLPLDRSATGGQAGRVGSIRRGHCEERQRQAIQEPVLQSSKRLPLDCFAPLAMTKVADEARLRLCPSFETPLRGSSE